MTILLGCCAEGWSERIYLNITALLYFFFHSQLNDFFFGNMTSSSSAGGQPKPASAESGYMLSLRPLENPFTADTLLLRVLSCKPLFLATNVHVYILDFGHWVLN